MTLQECINAIKKEYPNAYPHSYVEYDGKYVFNLINKGASPDRAISDMHIVDPETGYISGGISIMVLLQEEGFRKVWKHPNLVAHHDESIGHSGIKRSPFERGWGVRKQNTSGEESELTYGGSLSHHGIKGQHWGVQNGPPYPLDQKTHNKVVKNADKSPKISGKTGMSYEAAEALATLSVAAIPFLYYAGYKLFEKPIHRHAQKKFNERNNEISQDLIGDIADCNKTFSDDSLPKLIQGKHSVEDDMAACNPRYKDGAVPGTRVNCTLCSITYDLRRRGYDVTALCSDTGTYPEVLLPELYEDPPKYTKFRERSFSKTFDKVAQTYPEGSRGIFNAYAPFMGHTMAWEIKDGKMVVIDAQSNKKYTPSVLSEYGFDPQLCQFVRTDNLKLKPSGIHLASVELKPGWKKTIDAERKADEKRQKELRTLDVRVQNDQAAGLTKAQRIKNYEKLWKKEHPDAPNDAASRKAMANWVNAQISS